MCEDEKHNMSYGNKRLYGLICGYGELGCSRIELVRETLDMKRDDRKEHLDDLIDARLIECHNHKNGVPYYWQEGLYAKKGYQ